MKTLTYHLRHRSRRHCCKVFTTPTLSVFVQGRVEPFGLPPLQTQGPTEGELRDSLPDRPREGAEDHRKRKDPSRTEPRRKRLETQRHQCPGGRDTQRRTGEKKNVPVKPTFRERVGRTIVELSKVDVSKMKFIPGQGSIKNIRVSNYRPALKVKEARFLGQLSPHLPSGTHHRGWRAVSPIGCHADRTLPARPGWTSRRRCTGITLLPPSHFTTTNQ